MKLSHSPIFSKSALAAFSLAWASVMVSGCLPQASNSTQIEQKVGDTTLTGTVQAVGGQFFLDTGFGQPQSIDSYSISLDEYAGQTVTVTGQFSGNTLFVGKIEISSATQEQSSLVAPVQAAMEMESSTANAGRPIELKKLTPTEKQRLIEAGVDVSAL